MNILHSIILLLALTCTTANAQTYKGVFIGTNTTKILNFAGLNSWKQGFVLGYAMHSELSKPVAAQLEFLLSYEGGASAEQNLRVVTCYLKAPLMLNLKMSEMPDGSLRFLVGVQPTFYMGGFAKIGHKVYRPRIWEEDDKRYLQPNVNYFEEGRYAPRNWNMEFTGGIEVCKKHVIYGLRAAVGILQEERFQNSSMSFRFGF